jgi:putative methionine-R-sulfoxide reductase with GAF domain
MSNMENKQESSNKLAPLIDLIEEITLTESFEGLAKLILPSLVEMMNLRSAFFYIEDPRLLSSHFFEHGLLPESIDDIEKRCTKQLGKLSSQDNIKLSAIFDSKDGEKAADIIFYPITDAGIAIGLIGLIPEELATMIMAGYWEQILRVITVTISHLARNKGTETKLTYLNTYKTISSMLAQELGIHELLEAALYCSMDAVPAEAASILILDEEKENFKFYQTEGPVKPVLKAETFPADKGIAGYIVNADSAEIINDVQNDPRFYGVIDTESGFKTRNMIAVPLIAGEERIGVLEVLNKVDGGSFTEEERLLLSSIAEEMAFAIRNAKVFDYVVNSYCKQRQGQASCKGCKRPLGSWTPCIKYRDYEVE